MEYIGPKNRIEYLDWLKCFAIIMVLAGHAIQAFDGISNITWAIIYSFHMPLFMTLSGYFFESSVRKSFGSFLANRARQLLLPCLIFAFLVHPSLLSGGKLFISNFWFLKCLFIICLISYPLMRHVPFGLWILLAFSLLIQFQPFEFPYKIQFMFPCFVFGIVLQRYREFVDKNQVAFLIGSALLFFGFLCFWSWNFTIYRSPVRIFQLDSWVFDRMNAVITFYRLIVGLAGSLFFFVLAHILYKPSLLGSYMSRIGQETFAIYILQSFLLECACAKIGYKFDGVSLVIVVLAVTILELIGCYLIARGISQFRWLSLLLLGKKIN